MKRMKRDVREHEFRPAQTPPLQSPEPSQLGTRTTRVLPEPPEPPVPPESYQFHQNHQSHQNQPTLGRRSNKSRRELVTQAEMDLFIFLGRQTTVDSPNWTEPTLTRKELAGVTTETAQSTRFGPLSPGPIVSPVAEGGQAC